MDNTNLSHIPVSELTPENINSLKGNRKIPNPPRERDNRAPKNRILLIVGVILFVGVAVALFFIFRKPSESQEPVDDGSDNTELVWKPDDDAEDPSADYVNHQQSVMDNPEATADEKLDAELKIANLYSATERYSEAEEILNKINRDTLTNRQLFSLYSAYANLYNYKGDEASRDEYDKLVNEVLVDFWDEDVEESSPSTSEEQ